MVFNPNNTNSAAYSDNGGNIRRLCVPHASTGAEAQVQCSIHSVMIRNRPNLTLDTSQNGHRDIFSPHQDLEALRVTATVYVMGIPLHKIPATTTQTQALSQDLQFHPFEKSDAQHENDPSKRYPPLDPCSSSFSLYCHDYNHNTNSQRNGLSQQTTWIYPFNQHLSLPASWRDLPRDASIVFTVLNDSDSFIPNTNSKDSRAGSGSRILYQTTLRLFDSNGLLRSGLQKLLLYPIDGSTSSQKENNLSTNSSTKQNLPLHVDDTFGVSPSLLARREFHYDGYDHARFRNNTSNQGYGPEHERIDPLWKACLIMDSLNRQITKNSSSNNFFHHSHSTNLNVNPNHSNSNAKKSVQPSSQTPTVTATIDSSKSSSNEPSWLDKLTMQRCLDVLNPIHDEPNDQMIPYMSMPNINSSSISPEVTLASSSFLIIELPTSPIPIVHEEICYPHHMHGASGAITAHELSIYHKRLELSQLQSDSHLFSSGVSIPSDNDKESKNNIANATITPRVDDSNSHSNLSSSLPIKTQNTKYVLSKGEINEKDLGLELVQVLDHENENDNPVEDKYRTLAHDLIRGLVDPALKPNREQRARLASIISSPSHHPTLEEKDLLWRFRFNLVDNRRALAKFLLAVDWTVESEVVQAAELLEQWRKRSPIEVTDALKLLGKNVAFQTNLVRSYAIDTLEAAPDEELRLYLLQLVQALKFESATIESGPYSFNSKNAQGGTSMISSLASFLIDRASNNLELANDLYWYLKVELQNQAHAKRYGSVFSALEDKLSSTQAFRYISHSSSSLENEITPVKERSMLHAKTDSRQQSPQKTQNLSSFFGSVTKIGASLRGAEINDRVQSSSKDLHYGLEHRRSMWDILVGQDEFISSIMDCQLSARDERGKKDEKQNHLRKALASRGLNNCALKENAVPLPSAPNVMVTGIVPSTAIMFKSALYPAVIEFCVEHDTHSRQNNTVSDSDLSISDNNGPSYFPSSRKVIVKTGDDLRQDQLIIMMIRLMDGILKRYTLDLCLKPYSIIATSPTAGLVEFVEGSLPISEILARHNNSILQFFQKKAPMESAKYSIDPDVMQTYVNSCAGYCVITYLLGVGDRHLDNIMLQPSGHFFHIDFGFIFGRDPKPLPPPFRLTREMVDGMGGMTSDEYQTFCSRACQAFNVLRKKSAALVLNLLHLMSDAGIEDLSNNPSADADGVIAKVEERFRLDLTDEQAESFFLGLINDSLVAIAPRVMDVFHSFAVARR